MNNDMKRPLILRIFLIVILVGCFFFGISKLYWDSLLTAPNPSNKSEQLFVIQKGESLSQISQDLEDKKLIKSALAFKLLAKQTGAGGSIQAGDFKLSASMDSKEVLSQLSTGVIDKWVTLQEGLRVEEMAEKLNKELGLNKEDFKKVAEEGYMFPDTYLFNPKASAETIVSMMKNNFDKKYDTGLQAKINKQGLTSAQGVILASIVEREARSDEARKMVASILLKRFKIGMALNADATLQYILGYQKDEKSWWKRNLTNEDKKANSLFNTYLYAGLPPAPICNPSLSSLTAVSAANPATPYLYYYHDSQGRSHYGRNLDEHNDNVANYP
jgi:UPF0755 protein